MTNNSGKFVSTVSNKETTVQEMTAVIPAAPGSTVMDRIEEYFGRYWWAWIIALLIIIKTK
ncbi:MAG: hypothetical protein UHK44_07720 [Bacteroidaceae bacterium]|nr:hypothetical protein [Bacteroidaceae bacterium]